MCIRDRDTIQGELRRVRPLSKSFLHDAVMARAAGSSGSSPVSYTHLDVYKRQIPRWARTPPVTRRSVLRRDGGLCVYCSEPADTIDHVIPRSRGGTHDWSNVVAACKRDNLTKADQLLSELGWTLRVKPAPPDGYLWRLRHLSDVDPLWEPYLAAAS